MRGVPPPPSIGTPALWTASIAVVIALLALDFVLTRRPHAVSMREALGWSAFYLALPLAFGGFVWTRQGSDRGLEYLTGLVARRRHGGGVSDASGRRATGSPAGSR